MFGGVGGRGRPSARLVGGPLVVWFFRKFLGGLFALWVAGLFVVFGFLLHCFGGCIFGGLGVDVDVEVVG